MIDESMRFHDLVRDVLFYMMSIVGSLMMASIPFAIAGRGNRMLWLMLTPPILGAWFGLQALFKHTLHLETVALFFYPAAPALLCLAADGFRRWRESRSVIG